MTRQTRYVLGLDLGPVAAFTALAVVERSDDLRTDDPPEYAVRHLERFPPGTPYRTVAERVLGLLSAEPLEGAPVVIDVTAVGVGVLDLFRAADYPPELMSVILTAGHNIESGAGGLLVPKKDVVTGLQLLLQGRRLQVPTALPDAALLARELGNFRSKVTLNADSSHADWREGQDDDLVLAVALACWQAGRLPSCTGPGIEVCALRRSPITGGIYIPGVRGRVSW